MIERTSYFHYFLKLYSPSYWKLSGRWINSSERQSSGQSILYCTLASVRTTLSVSDAISSNSLPRVPH